MFMARYGSINQSINHNKNEKNEERKIRNFEKYIYICKF